MFSIFCNNLLFICELKEQVFNRAKKTVINAAEKGTTFFDDRVALEQFYKLDDTFCRQRCNLIKQTQISGFFPQIEI